MNDSARHVYGDNTLIMSEEIQLLDRYFDEASGEEKTMLGKIIHGYKVFEKDSRIVADSLATVQKAREELKQLKKDLKLYKLIANLANQSIDGYDNF